MGSIVSWLIKQLLNPIAFILFSVLWVASVTPIYLMLEALVAIKGVFGFGFAKKLFFGDTNEINFLQVPTLFLIISSISVAISIIVLCVVIFKNAISLKENNTKELLKQAFKTFILLISLPIIYLLSLLILDAIDQLTRQLFFSDNNLSETQNIFLQLRPNKINQNEWYEFAKSYFSDANKIRNSYNNLDWGEGSQIILLFLIATIILLIFQGWMLINLGKKLIIMFIYMIIAPLFISLIMLDNEKEFSKFKSEIKNSITTVISAEFFYSVFVLFISFAMNFEIVNNIPILASYTNFIFKIISLAGASFGVMQFIKKMEATSPTMSNVVKGAKSVATGAVMKNPAMINQGLKTMSSNSVNNTSNLPSVKNDVIKNNNFNSVPKTDFWNSFKTNKGESSIIPTKELKGKQS
ncbi:Mbov_0396 family ICE element transmembrane protein [Mesomycoplasma lagogenitalium]|uniref:Conjugal transfer protein TrbL n=1 Tax=Mesomycoplasma lagogenitalium TaxID=171286 RepID=A0ABY8LUK3_9BACT|nr:hypothetical protein [Mesomycoplasma lagogenitalium]WGI36924.1 hypothetical protein QEG99_01420 [Mesomycoplasma lagogenitalium]